jgi:hypothetical protein
VHLHNQLLAAIHGNLTREMPDQGPAPWVSANDKPAPPTGAKPVTGDATERRLKGDIMQLPARDRRRIKDLALNDVRTTWEEGVLLPTFTNVINSMILARVFSASSTHSAGHLQSLMFRPAQAQDLPI